MAEPEQAVFEGGFSKMQCTTIISNIVAILAASANYDKGHHQLNLVPHKEQGLHQLIEKIASLSAILDLIWGKGDSRDSFQQINKSTSGTSSML